MNLFYLDLVAKKSARYHCDKHVVKLILEATQMLYSVWHLCEPNENWKSKAPSNYMKLTHQNHPLSKWVRTNNKTYDMVAEYCHSLLEEYTLRYGKIHSSKLHMDFLTNNYPSQLPKSTDLPLMPLCMPDDYKVKPATKWSDVVDSYRAYYIGEKLHFCSYKGVDWPDWLPARTVIEKKDKATKASTKKKATKTPTIKKESTLTDSNASTKKKVTKTPTTKKESILSTVNNNNNNITQPTIKKESLSSSTITTSTTTTKSSSIRLMTTTTTSKSTTTKSNKDYLLLPSLFNPNPLLGATTPILTRSRSNLKIE